jgi:hypothetical protein
MMSPFLLFFGWDWICGLTALSVLQLSSIFLTQTCILLKSLIFASILLPASYPTHATT